MSGAPSYKVYRPLPGNGTKREYVASCKYLEDAAAIVALYGDGAQIRWLHRAKNVLWTEGVDGRAGDSLDDCAASCRQAFLAQREAGEL